MRSFWAYGSLFAGLLQESVAIVENVSDRREKDPVFGVEHHG